MIKRAAYEEVRCRQKRRERKKEKERKEERENDIGLLFGLFLSKDFSGQR